HGACVCLMDVFGPGRALWLVERERCTVWNCVDQMARAVLDSPELDRYDRSSLRTGAFAAVGGGGHGMFEAVVERMAIPLAYQPYGMTEVNAMALVQELEEPAELRAVHGNTKVHVVDVRIAHPATGAHYCDS